MSLSVWVCIASALALAAASLRSYHDLPRCAMDCDADTRTHLRMVDAGRAGARRV